MKHKSEVVIIGGGSAGVTAAISAANLGKTVTLIGDRPVLGGNSSSEIRVWTRGSVGAGILFGEEMGPWGELKMRNLYVNPKFNPIFWDEVLFEKIHSFKNINLLLNTYISDVRVIDGKLISVSGVQMSTENKVEISGEVFIDCTGDGSIGDKCGIPSSTVKEARDIYNESLAPENEKNERLGSTIFFYSKKLDKKTEYIAPDYVYSLEYVEKLLGNGGRIVREDYNGCDYWWFEFGGLKDTIKESQNNYIELKKMVLGIWNYIKNSGKFDSDYLTMEWIGTVPGKRESRRMITEKILTQKEVLEGHDDNDIAFYGGWYMDFHPSEGIFAQDEFCTQIATIPYGVSYKTLFNKNISNLLFAGRNIGTSHVAFASSRIMNTCALSGQAAATLAHLMIDEKKSAYEIENIEKMRQLILKDDGFLLSLKNNDELDYARQAKVTASSVCTVDLKNDGGKLNLSDNVFLIIPQDVKDLKLLVISDENTKISGHFVSQVVPSRLTQHKRENKFEFAIEKGENWISLPFDTKEGFTKFMFDNNEKVYIALSSENLEGFLCGQKTEPKYFTPCIKVSENAIYSAENVINGYNRPYSNPNLWISAIEKTPSLEFDFDKEICVNQLRITFNPNLSEEITSACAGTWSEHHKFHMRDGLPENLVKSFEILAFNDSKWTKITETHENWKRLAVIDFENEVKCSKIKVVITSTHGSDKAEIFEVRIY